MPFVLYTPERGNHTRVPWGTSVVVEDGVIKDIRDGDVEIPKNGFAVKLFGTEKRYIDRFPKGAKAYYTVDFETKNSNNTFWEGWIVS